MKFTFNKNKPILRTLITIVSAQQIKMTTLGPVLSPYDLNINTICKGINDATKEYPIGFKVSVHVTIYQDKSFEVQVKGPTVGYLLKQFLIKSKSLNKLDIYKMYKIKKSLDNKITFSEFWSTIVVAYNKFTLKENNVKN